jgi:hypothetical protein
LAGAALVGSALIVSAPAPIAPTKAKIEAEIQSIAVRLAADSIANIPANLIQTLANIPANELAGINATTKALNDSGNWWLYIPTNVVGFDQQDKEKVQALTLALMPIPALAAALSDQLWITLAAEAPMTSNCTGIPGPCTDPIYFDQYFQVPLWKLLTGYTFPSGLANTIDPYDETWNGVDIQPDWAGDTVTLDPLGPAKALWKTLTQDPTGVEAAPTPAEFAAAYRALAAAAWNGLNPFVTGTYCLPCQLVVPGAPGSLPKFSLFGKYYTIFNLGQQLTDENWVGGPQPVDEHGNPPWIEDVTVTNFWTKEAWEQIYRDARGEGADTIDSFPNLPQSVNHELAADAERVHKLLTNIANQFSITGNADGAQAVAASFAALVSKVLGSLEPATQQDTVKSLTSKTNTLTAVRDSTVGVLDAPKGLKAAKGGAGVETDAVSAAKSLFAGPRDGQNASTGGLFGGKAGLPAKANSASGAAAAATGDITKQPASDTTDSTKPSAKDGSGPSTPGAGAGTKPRAPLGNAAKSVGEQIGKTARKVADGLKGGKQSKSDSPSSASGTSAGSGSGSGAGSGSGSGAGHQDGGGEHRKAGAH